MRFRSVVVFGRRRLIGAAGLDADIATGVARLTRRWFLPAAPGRRNGVRRRIPLMLGSSAVTVTLWVLAFRRQHPGRHGGRPVIHAAAR
ncbi:hypothetical protein BAY61_32335 (plasmid) [Prauserella marina]|uniref:Uncharacterized protein n=1 Tax=Prauserella marina TaxID=530584 RepID=A0A222W1X7_9PSEU|nr:hypothetical protein [Prauserella marina]ASR39971.1 hypothetical protein BAY61_32335 [Prauserella marina]PWV71309.1 hypothetical protein DES30_11225 [Prauserella marina]SDD96841.1 hypothetical protein SAMN05421630_11587 [Prauserella marina]